MKENNSPDIADTFDEIITVLNENDIKTVDDMRKIINRAQTHVDNKHIQKPAPKRRGRKAGKSGFKCKKLRYRVTETTMENPDGELIGDYSTMQEIADHYNLKYQKIVSISKGNGALSKKIKITKL